MRGVDAGVKREKIVNVLRDNKRDNVLSGRALNNTVGRRPR